MAERKKDPIVVTQDEQVARGDPVQTAAPHSEGGGFDSETTPTPANVEAGTAEVDTVEAPEAGEPAEEERPRRSSRR